MKTHTFSSFVAYFFTVLTIMTLCPRFALAQGSLTPPPGVPAPTMKTLQQVEPRTPISTAPYTINTSGSYYLTTNLAVTSGNAITIAVDNVTLDLNGFTISSTEPAPPTNTGVLLGGSGTRRNIAIFNGSIISGVTNTGGTYSGKGFNFGIFYYNPPINVRVSNVSVSGCLTHGINLGTQSTVVTLCTVNTVGSTGITAQSVSDSTAKDCGYDGIDAYTANNCYGEATGFGNGIVADSASNCYGLTKSGNGGIHVYNAHNCMGGASGSGGYGVNATTATNCTGYSSNGYGIFTLIANNCIGSDDGNGKGLDAEETAICSYGFSASGVGLYAYIANSCRGVSTSGTAQSIIFKYNMP